MSKVKKKYEIDMCTGPIFSKLLLFAVPLMLSSILQLLFNAADVIVVGRYAGDNALAAVGSNTSLINLLTNFFMGLSIGANVLVARFYGAKQDKDLEETIHTTMFVSVISGILLTIIGGIGARQILILMQAPEKVLDLSVIYLRIYFAGITATMIYNFGSAILRAVGDTKRPLYYLLFAGIVNVILNLLFVIVFNMGVAGVATATVISQCISATLVVRCLMKNTGSLKFELSKMRIHKEKLIGMIKIGFPASIQGMVFSFSNVIIQSSINSFGEIVVAGSSAAANIEGFVYMAMNAFYQAAISFTSQNVGAAKYERVNKILINAEICVIIVGGVMGNLVYIFGEQLLGLFTTSPAVIEQGMIRLGVISTLYALCGIMDVVVGSLRGLGYAIVPMVVSIIGACGLRLLWIFTFFRLEEFHSPMSLYLTYPVTWTITLTAHFICFFVIRRKLAKKWGM